MMKTPTFNYSIHLLVTFLIGILLTIFLLKSCEGPQIIPSASRTIKSDTVWIAGKDTTITIVKWYPKSAFVHKTPDIELKNNWCDSIRAYVDTLQIDTSSYVVCTDSVVGIKKYSEFRYFGNPYYQQITTTITDSIPYPFSVPKRSVYLSVGVGVSKLNNSLYIGVDYFGKKRMGAGYAFDVINNSHNGFVRIKLY